MSRSRGIAGLVALGCLLLPALANAEVYRGDTSQRFDFKLRTNGKGAATRVATEFRAPCQYGGRLEDNLFVLQPFDRSNGSGFKDAGYFTKDGDYYTTCRTGLIRWSASAR